MTKFLNIVGSSNATKTITAKAVLNQVYPIPTNLGHSLTPKTHLKTQRAIQSASSAGFPEPPDALITLYLLI